MRTQLTRWKFEVKFLFSFCLTVLFLLACATSPTGRRQLLILPDSQINAMGVDSFSELKKTTPIENDPATNRYVKCVAQAVAKEAGASGIQNWEVVVFKDASANAFALPGGKIGVHTGILKVAKTADQLAAVLGHEVGHVIAHHGNERVSQNLATQGGLVALSTALSNSETKGVLLAGLGLGAQYGVLLPFSRTQESEADLIGLDLMARAGFDPRQSVELWKNMSQAGGGSQPPQFLSTHPSHQTRIENLQSHFSETVPTYEKAKSQGRNPNCS